MTFDQAIKIIRTMEFETAEQLELASTIVCNAAELRVGARRATDAARDERYRREQLEREKEALIWRNPFGAAP